MSVLDAGVTIPAPLSAAAQDELDRRGEALVVSCPACGLLALVSEDTCEACGMPKLSRGGGGA